jgi:hypothetical protein
MSTSAVPVIDWSAVLGLVKTKKEHHAAALAALTKLEHAAETLHRTNLSVLELRGQLAGAEEQLEVDRATAAAAHSQALAFLTVAAEPAADATALQPEHVEGETEHAADATALQPEHVEGETEHTADATALQPEHVEGETEHAADATALQPEPAAQVTT